MPPGELAATGWLASIATTMALLERLDPQSLERVLVVLLLAACAGCGDSPVPPSASGANYSAAKLGIVGLSKSIALDMSRVNVRSNCIAPFAWSRLIGSIPINDDTQRARVDTLK